MPRSTKKGGGKNADRRRQLMAEKARATIKAKAEASPETVLSDLQEDARRRLCKELFSEFVEDFNIDLPTTAIFENIADEVNTLTPGEEPIDKNDILSDIPDKVQYNNSIMEENGNFKLAYRLVLTTILGVCIEECENGLKSDKKVMSTDNEKNVRGQLLTLRKLYNGMTTSKTIENGKTVRIPLRQNRTIQTGGVNGIKSAAPLLIRLNSSTPLLFSGTKYESQPFVRASNANRFVQQVPTSSPAQQPASIQGNSGAPQNYVVKTTPGIEVSSATNSKINSTFINQFKNNAVNNENAKRLSRNLNRQSILESGPQNDPVTNAMKLISQAGEKPITLSAMQQRGMAIVSKLYEFGVPSLYNPLDRPHTPIVSEEMTRRFRFIKGEFDKLKETLTRDSTGRFEVLQYNSFLNIIESIHIGKLNLIDTRRTKVIENSKAVSKKDLNKVMIDLANYNDQYKDVTVDFVRKKPTMLQSTKAAFTFSEAVNYAMQEIDIFYTDLNDGLQYVIQLNPLQAESAFIPFVFRFLFNIDKVTDISKMMSTVKNYLKIEPSYAGFWSPDVPTSVLLAGLRGANSVTKKIISVAGQYTKLASDMANYKHFDYLADKLGKIVKDPSQALALRTKAAEIRERTYALVESENVWGVEMTDALTDMATQMAIVSGRLDETIKADEVNTKFVEEMAQKVGNALKDTLSGVAEAGELTAKSFRNVVSIGDDIRIMFLNGETAVILLFFLVKYFALAAQSANAAVSAVLSGGTEPVFKSIMATLSAQVGNKMLQDATGGYVHKYLTAATMVAVIIMMSEQVGKVGAVGTAKLVANSIKGSMASMCCSAGAKPRVYKPRKQAAPAAAAVAAAAVPAAPDAAAADADAAPVPNVAAAVVEPVAQPQLEVVEQVVPPPQRAKASTAPRTPRRPSAVPVGFAPASSSSSSSSSSNGYPNQLRTTGVLTPSQLKAQRNALLFSPVVPSPMVPSISSSARSTGSTSSYRGAVTPRGTALARKQRDALLREFQGGYTRKRVYKKTRSTHKRRHRR